MSMYVPFTSEQVPLSGEKRERWSITPQIESLSPMESMEIYAGQFTSVLEIIDSLGARERDEAVLHLSGEAGRCLLGLRVAAELHLNDFHEPEKAARYFRSAETLCKFIAALHGRYQKDEPVETSRSMH